MRRITLTLIAFVAAGARAHDFWIEPSTFRPKTGQSVVVSLRVGEHFVGDPVPRDSSAIERFVVRDAAGERTVAGREGQDPAGLFRAQRAGLHLVGYRSRPRLLALPAEKFEQFLREEGLERIVRLRAQRGQTAKPSREIFSRCAKSLVGTGDGIDRPLGMRLEITPESIGAEARVRVTYENAPLEGALVVAMHRDDPSLRIGVRSDRNGRATFPLPKRGVWMIKSVHMVPAPPASGAEWESLWASLTFER